MIKYSNPVCDQYGCNILQQNIEAESSAMKKKLEDYQKKATEVSLALHQLSVKSCGI